VAGVGPRPRSGAEGHDSPGVPVRCESGGSKSTRFGLHAPLARRPDLEAPPRTPRPVAVHLQRGPPSAAKASRPHPPHRRGRIPGPCRYGL